MKKSLLLMAVALLVAGALTGLVGYRAFAQEEETVITWPEFAMDYAGSGTASVGSQVQPLTLTYRLTYNGQNDWQEDILTATSVETSWGTFSRAGSYKKLDGTQLTDYDAAFDHTTVETIAEGTTRIPHANFYPIGLEKLESADLYNQKAVAAATGVRICFDDVCEDNATGWKFTVGDQERYYADDERGIPLTFSGMTVTELRVVGAKQAYER